jgi:hypothetical protein
MSSIKGIVKSIGERETFTSGFYKQQLVITTLGDYPQLLPFDFAKDKGEALNGLEVGQAVEVFFDLRGKEGTTPGRIFVDLNGWKVERAG